VGRIRRTMNGVSMSEEITELREQLEKMQAKLDELETESRPAPVMNRRRALTTLAAGAAGAAASTIAFANPAAATDGGNIVIGNKTQTVQSPTALIASGFTTGSTLGGFSVTDDTTPNSNTSAALSCLVGIATGNPFTVGILGASSDPGGVGAKLDGPTPLKLADSTNAGAPTPTIGTNGMFRFVSGDLYFCVDDTSSDRWRLVTGAASAGTYIPIAPARAYDSRWSAGPITAGQNRTILVANKYNQAGVLQQSNVVPVGARAVTYNLTIANTVSGGYLSLVPGNSVDFSTSTINWASGGLVLANGSTSKLDTSRQVKVACGSGTTDFIIDITGYYF